MAVSLSTLTVKQAQKELRSAGDLIASAELKLNTIGHFKASDVRKLRNRLNNLIHDLDSKWMKKT